MLRPYNPIQQSSRGLGDTIAKAAKAMGIKQTPGCGCEKRQEVLNKLIDYMEELKEHVLASGAALKNKK